MFMSANVEQIGSKTDRLSMTFHCHGVLDTHYSEFLDDASEAVTRLYTNYEEYGVPPNPAAANDLKQKIINAIDRTVSEWRNA